MKTNPRLESNLPAPLDERQLEDRFDSYLDDTNESIIFMGCTLIPSTFLKDTDETAYHCAFNDWLDSECRNGDIKEYDGSYYDKDYFESAVEETISEAETELVIIQDDITGLQEKESEIDMEDKAALAPLEEELERLHSLEEDLQSELKELNNLR